LQANRLAPMRLGIGGHLANALCSTKPANYDLLKAKAPENAGLSVLGVCNSGGVPIPATGGDGRSPGGWQPVTIGRRRRRILLGRAGPRLCAMRGWRSPASWPGACAGGADRCGAVGRASGAAGQRPAAGEPRRDSRCRRLPSRSWSTARSFQVHLAGEILQWPTTRAPSSGSAARIAAIPITVWTSSVLDTDSSGGARTIAHLSTPDGPSSASTWWGSGLAQSRQSATGVRTIALILGP